MNFYTFSDSFGNLPVFSTAEIEKRFPGFERENLLNWQKKGYLVKIRNGWYSLSKSVKTLEQAYFMANKIYAPSYLSLQSAFAYYGWIPEGVFSYTSISTRKTILFDTVWGRFTYTSIKSSLFFGYRVIHYDGFRIKMAEPEKALLDFIYFNPKLASKADFESYRFNLIQMQTDIFHEHLEAYRSLFASPIIDRRLFIIKKMIDNA